MLPSNLENKKKRLVYQHIENKKGKQFADYQYEFEYLIESGISLCVKAISNPRFPLKESEQKNLMKLYLNDVGLLTGILYDLNINAVLQDENSINLGTVYESLVAQELRAHGQELFYYDNKKRGEVDFLVNDFQSLSVLPIEVKSGKDYTIHSALTTLIQTADFHTKRAIVLNNAREVITKNGITYMPIYYAMFLQSYRPSEDDLYIPLP